MAPTKIEYTARHYAKGIGEAVADRTINRQIKTDLDVEPRTEQWSDVARRVSMGNTLLHPFDESRPAEYENLHAHMAKASVLMSGRHLQHGDETMPERPIEVYTNCSSSCMSSTLFMLLLNGSGVGRSYDDALMAVDWGLMPNIALHVDDTHPDIAAGLIKDAWVNAKAEVSGQHTLHRVEDSREGWAKAIERIETMAYAQDRTNDTLVLDFTDVRPYGSPIAGMQNRPASGPAPLMESIEQLSKLKSADMPIWAKTMHVDHYLAECVRVGGARRAARMSTKDWRDPGILEFIGIKRGGGLWSSNNSVTVDAEFWAANKRDPDKPITETIGHAQRVFKAIVDAQYNDGTGEPGLINQDTLVTNNKGLDVFADGQFAGSDRYQLSADAVSLGKDLMDRASKMRYSMIVNPCGEIALSVFGGYCVIGDVVPFHTDSDEEAEDAFRACTRALIRTNQLDALYRREVQRTNRIGVGMTGLHEYAYSRFGFTFHDLVDEAKSQEFWNMLSRFSHACVDEADRYSKELGMNAPHTVTTVKPSGSVSKLFGLSEGIHLPAMREYIRWVQFKSDDPLVSKYKEQGYKARNLKNSYTGTTIVGFPTQPKICEIVCSEDIVTAPEAPPESQYQFLKLLEKYWLGGYSNGKETLAPRSNQISYTLKYRTKMVSVDQYTQLLLEHQPDIKCCSVMPEIEADESVYEYLPEEAVSQEEYRAYKDRITESRDVTEDVGIEHVSCESGACPVDYRH